MSKYEPLWKYLKDNKKELNDYGYVVKKKYERKVYTIR